MFKKFLEVERLGRADTQGLLEGNVWVFPKLDGANGSLWAEKDEATENLEIYCGSRNFRLDPTRTNSGFWNYVQEKKEHYLALLKHHPSWTLYGEWMVPHSVKGYREDVWRQFFVYDVFDRDTQRYLSFEEYSPALAQYSIEQVLPVATIENPTLEMLGGNVWEKALSYKMQDGLKGEGIVLKNYSFVNSFGHYLYGKIVRDSFAEENTKAMGVPKLLGPKTHEDDFVNGYVTRGRIEKLLNKLEGTDRRSKIHKFLETLYYELINEELYDFVKKGKKLIDFAVLRQKVFFRAKQMTPELFGVSPSEILSNQTQSQGNQEQSDLQLQPQSSNTVGVS